MCLFISFLNMLSILLTIIILVISPWVSSFGRPDKLKINNRIIRVKLPFYKRDFILCQFKWDGVRIGMINYTQLMILKGCPIDRIWNLRNKLKRLR